MCASVSRISLSAHLVLCVLSSSEEDCHVGKENQYSRITKGRREMRNVAN